MTVYRKEVEYNFKDVSIITRQIARIDGQQLARLDIASGNMVIHSPQFYAVAL